MRRGLAVALAASLWAASGQAGAQVVEMEREGQAGVWMPLDAMRAIVSALDEAERRETHIRLLEERLRLGDERMATLERIADVAERHARAATDAAIAAETRAGAAIRAADAWWRHPVLWVIVGAVIGAGGALLAIAIGGV